MARKALFNVARMCCAEQDTPIEVSFLSDFEFTCKQLNKYEPGRGKAPPGYFMEKL